MNFSKLVLSFHVLILLLTASCEAEGRGAVKGPLIWDMSNFEKLKTDTSYSRLYKSIIKESNNICEMPPVTVMDKVKTFAPDKHYFCSIGTYWWPDPNNPGQYINKDGKTNPECNLYDRASLSIMSKRCQNLCVAYYLTKDEKYYDAFIRQIKAWFIDEETYMYPNFEYAQVIPGRNENKGRSTGYIGAYPFNSVLESIRLTNAIKEIDSQTLKSLKKWFLKFAECHTCTWGMSYGLKAKGRCTPCGKYACKLKYVLHLEACKCQSKQHNCLHLALAPCPLLGALAVEASQWLSSHLPSAAFVSWWKNWALEVSRHSTGRGRPRWRSGR